MTPVKRLTPMLLKFQALEQAELEQCAIKNLPKKLGHFLTQSIKLQLRNNYAWVPINAALGCIIETLHEMMAPSGVEKGKIGF